MASKANPFVWYDLMTNDADAATKFYTAVVGWDAVPSPDPDMPYTLLMANGLRAAGLMAIPPEAAARGVAPMWMGYVGVADADAATASVVKGGGRVLREPDDIPGVGRFSVVADPQGVAFQLFAPAPGEVPQTPPPPMASGHVGWRELHSTDPKAGFDFYAGQFGWTKGDAMDMGPMGTYQIFSMVGATDSSGMMSGGMMKKTDEMPVAMWLYYFSVADIDAAKDRVEDNGGKVLFGPGEVPGGAWIVQALDPQGALFALVGLRNS
jgi:predicted enzyme related to lactoylglutathione lyase